MSGTAAQGRDYVLSSTTGQVIILAGQSSATVTLRAKKDNAAENTETAIITLQPGGGYKLGNQKKAMISILDGP